jgi:hypothetical protein
MPRSEREPDRPSLFDLPLADGERQAASPWVEEPADGEPEGAGVWALTPAASLRDRFQAGVGDLALHALVGFLVVLVLELLHFRVRLEHLPALALFLLTFSFPAITVPLAFWGRTAGMAMAGLIARSEHAALPSFGQAFRRWLGLLVSLLLLGLPTLAALVGGRSLADRWSGLLTKRA